MKATAKPAKESHLSGACPKRESKRDLTGSSDDNNDEKEMERCPWDASEPGTSDERTGRQLSFLTVVSFC